MRAELNTFVESELPEWPPVIGYEITEHGWRGLTMEGEVLEVAYAPGHAVTVPSEIVVAHAGVPIARREVRSDTEVRIDEYLASFNRVVELYRANEITQALAQSVVPSTLRARHNRAMVLLAAGQWDEGLREYWEVEQCEPFLRPPSKAALGRGLKPWRGEDLRDKRLALIHAHGHGDTIMTLRFVPRLRAMAAEVVLVLPPELAELGLQFGQVWNESVDADYFCPMLHLLHLLKITPERVPTSSYLRVGNRLIEHWLLKLNSPRKKIGLAWSIGKPSDGDYPRQIPLELLVREFGDCELHSVQLQDAEHAEALGVKTHKFANFSDCAAVMTLMDEIISVDTAALHLAGAIGHPKVHGLLSHWASWRWVVPWYRNVQLCRQTSHGDWASALAQVR